jgi:hypothetical protein
MQNLRKPLVSLLRETVGAILDRNKHATEMDAFGLWGDRTVHGLAYQENIRRELYHADGGD